MPLPRAYRPAERPRADLAGRFGSGRANCLPYRATTATVDQVAVPLKEALMGDKSPKSKQRDQKQKDVAKAVGAAEAKAKQDSHNRAPKSPK